MLGTYNGALVCLSILIAITASYSALDLANRVRASSGWARHGWLATASLAMGGGIWAMHFVGMLAFNLPGMTAHYELWPTVLSLLVPIGVTGIGFLAISRETAGRYTLPLAGLCMGLGIGAMHYIGMAAMEMPAVLTYEPFWVILSLLIAVLAATFALRLSLRVHHLAFRLVAAVAMGAAISGMHYAAMKGAVFSLGPEVGMAHGEKHVLDPIGLAVAVAASTFLILFLALLAAMYDRRRALMSEREAAALRQSEERFRSLYRHSPLPLHSLDSQGRIEHVSEAWLDLLGYRYEEVVGRPLINFMTEDSARQMLDLDWPRLLQSGELKEVEYRLVTRTGVFLDVVASARLERDERGTILHALGGLINVTERKRIETALRQSQKMEAIGKLTGGVAHDFNNLLAVVVGNLQLLRRRVAGDPKAASLIENALLGAQRGASLTQRMLAFARKQELKPEAVDLPELVRGMGQLLQRSVGPNITLETHFALSLPSAYIDANQLELVLLNLVINARDAMPDGGVICIQASEQSSSEAKPGRFIRLAVSDTGEGMDEDTLAHATEPFFSTKGVGKGTGLGLSMALGMAEQSGGRLVLTSKRGQGTTVELWLPVAQATQQEPSRLKAVAPASQASPLTLLVVDDDELVLANTADMLEDLGHRVHTAASGQQALAWLEVGHPVDLLITDQVMPQMTGVQLADLVRAARPGLPILLMSGYVDLPQGVQTSLQRLNKPFTQGDLQQAIQALMSTGASGEVIPLFAKH